MTRMSNRNGNSNGTGARRGQIVDPDDGLPGGYDNELDSGYNPADFIIPGSDHLGHSERVFCRCQPQHARALNVIYRAKKFPFRTEGDMFRWCLVRGLKVLDRLDPTPGFFGVADAIGEVMKQEMYQQEFTSMFGTMEKVIAQHVATGAEGEARKMLGTVIRHIRTIDGDDHWKDKCESEVIKRFGHLIEGGKSKAKLLGERP